MATLTINFVSNNNPTNGYIVKYRQVGTEVYTTLSQNPMSSPISITGLGSGVSYEGTIQADCGNGQKGTVATFNATVAAPFNWSYDPSSSANACSLTTYNNQVYSSTSNLQANQYIYQDEYLTQRVTKAGYYSNGQYIYQVDNSGKILSITACTVNP